MTSDDRVASVRISDPAGDAASPCGGSVNERRARLWLSGDRLAVSSALSANAAGV